MSLNSRTLNKNAVNDTGIKALGSGTLVSIEQDITLRESGSGTLVAIEQSVEAVASGTLVSIEQYVYNAATTDNVTLHGWDLIIYINGSLVSSSKIHGKVFIKREEGSAALATLTLIPDAGVQDLTLYQGKPITIDVRESGGITRLYTGTIDIPDVDLIEKKITLRCTDKRREQINSQLASAVKEIGFFSSKVFSTVEDTADELDKRLSTVPKSLDFDAYGNYHITDWEPKSTADYTLTDSSIYYRDPEIEIVRRGKLVNQVNLELEYRFTRLHQRQLSWQWTHPAEIDECNFLLNGQTMTSRSAVQAAANASGWRVTPSGITFGGIMDAGWYSCGSGFNNYIAWSPVKNTYQRVPVTDALGNHLKGGDGELLYEAQRTSATDYSQLYCNTASWSATKRWAQTIQETYTLTVKAPQSITQYGTVERDETFGIEDPYDASGWESNQASNSTGTYFVNQTSNYKDFNEALICLVNRAKTTILRGHRENYTRIYRSLWSAIDLRHTVEINTASNPNSGSAGFDTKGKVVRIEHEFNIGTREAYTRVETAAFTAQGSTTATDIKAPSRPSDTAPTSFGTITLGNHFGEDPANGASWSGMIGNQIVNGVMTNYPVSFVVDAPAIESAVRDARTITQTSTYNIEIPNNTFTITF